MIGRYTDDKILKTSLNLSTSLKLAIMKTLTKT
jgi:hypothetical protein